MTDQADPTTLRLDVGVELADSIIYLVVRGSLAGEDALMPVPVTPKAARALASRLLGAAAAADPAGHQAILDGIAQAVTEAQHLLVATPHGSTLYVAPRTCPTGDAGLKLEANTQRADGAPEDEALA